MTAIATSTELAAALPHERQERCPVCDRRTFCQKDVLWPELIRAWGLDPSEALLINQQQGYSCTGCSANLRSMTLAAALLDHLDFPGSLEQWVASGQSDRLRLLEINPAGQLHACLSRVPTCLCLAYPQTDMQALDLADASFDLVLHSDTLEHVPDPVRALRECRRVLRPHGRMLMTILIVPTRLTRRCDGLPPSYHGNAQEHPADFRVCTEYGADFFLDLLLAGWTKISLFSLGTAASLAVIGVK